jgi:hypothetical protein
LLFVYVSVSRCVKVYNPDSGIELKINTATYVGTPVAFAKVTLVWTLSRGSFANAIQSSWYPTQKATGCGWTSGDALLPPEDRSTLDTESGIVAVVTDADGHATYNLLLDIEQAPVEGDSITYVLCMLSALQRN